MRALRSIILAGVAAATLVAGTGAALADPSAPPPEKSIVATGSDTIEFLADAAATTYNTTHTVTFNSWDAVNPNTGVIGDTIDTKNDPNCSISRPDGSGAGIKQLQAKLKTSDGKYYCVDLARASRNIQSTDGTGIVSVKFAQDNISWASNSSSHAVANLTDTDLQAIYECNASLINPADSGPVTWNEVGGTSTDAIVPVLPQSSSGTRAQWLLDLGNPTIGSCVVNGTYNGNLVEENEGTNAVFTATGNPTGYKDIVFPFSAGDYICQLYTKACPDQHGTLLEKSIDGKVAIHTTTTGTHVLTTTFPAVYIRGLYYVAFNAGTAAAPAVPNGTNLAGYTINLTTFLGQGNTSGWICSTAGKANTKKFGFLVPTTCGSLTGQ